MKNKFLIVFLTLFTTLQINAQVWSEIERTTPPPYNNATYHYFGNSVAIDGDVAVVASVNYLLQTGRVTVIERIGGTWQKVAELSASDAAIQDNFGVDVDISGDVIVVGANLDDDTYSGSGSVYVFEKPVGGWQDMTETCKLNASDPGSSDYFGYAVAIDGNYIVAGAYCNDDNGLQSGSAYVFEKPVSGWQAMTETAKLLPSDGASNDYFGCSIDISGNIVIVGAYNDDDNGSNSGSVYLFEKPVTGWVNSTQTAKLLASDGVIDDNFGQYLSISGNVIAVTAPARDESFTNTGSIYVFEKSGANWVNATQNAKLISSDITAYDYLGVDLCIDGDYILAGAYHDFQGGSYTGSAYMFHKSGSAWHDTTEVAKFIASDAGADDRFGFAVGLSGDRFIIGAQWNDDLGVSSGSAYLFEKPIGDWTDTTETAKILPATVMSSTYDKYGYSVDIDGNTAVVGSIGYNQNAGRAFVYEFDGNAWSRIAELHASNETVNYQFGYSVAIENDIIYIGAPAAAGHYTSDGAIYVYEKTPSGWNTNETCILYGSDAGNSDKFGASLSVHNNTLVVGAPYNDQVASNAGAAYVFVKPTGSWVAATETAKITSSDGAANDNLGFAVSISDSTIALGAPYSDVIYSNSGSVYLYEKPVGSWISATETAKIIPGDTAASNYFGFSVAIENDVLVVGSTKSDAQATDAGAVYIYEKPGVNWAPCAETAILSASDGVLNAEFGVSVDIQDSLILVGSKNISYRGAVYGYYRTSGGWNNATQDFKLTSSLSQTDPYFGFDIAISGSNIIVTEYNSSLNSPVEGAAYFFRYLHPAAISQNPADQINVCDSVWTEFTFSSTDAHTIVWEQSSDNGVNWLTISDDATHIGATNDTLFVLANTANDGDLMRSIVSNILGADTSMAAILKLDTIAPQISCPTNQNISIPIGQTYYTVSGTEFDPVSSSDNCTVSSVLNDFNSSSSLSSEQIPLGNNAIIWTVTDNSGNTDHCSFDVNVSVISGISEMVDEILLYPNPVNNYVFASGMEGLYNVLVYDNGARQVISLQNVIPQNGICVSDLPAGFYTIQFQNEQQSVYLNFIKE